MSGSLPQVPNYLPNIQSPFAAAVQGLQIGQAFGEAASAEQQRASMQSAMQAFQRNPSPQTLTPLLTSLPPQTAEVLRKHWEGMETGQRESNIAFGGQAMSAILAGRTDLASDLFMQRATAFENAGRADEAKFNRDMAELVKVNPQFALAFGASTLGTSEGGERMLKNILAATREPVAQRRGQAEAIEAEAKAGVAPIVAGAGAAEALARARNTEAPGLSEAATERVNEAFTASDAARTRSGQLTELNDKITAAVRDDITNSGGQFGRGYRNLVELVGGSTEYARLLREFTRLRNAEVIRALPPGIATNQDIALISAGFPGVNGSTEEIQQFLAAAARIAAYEADYNRFRGMFMDANSGSMGRARRSFEIDGVTIPAGADMSSAFRRVITPRIEAQQNMQTLQDNPRLSRFVQPPAGQ
jgi:hypothetical protein